MDEYIPPVVKHPLAFWLDVPGLQQLLRCFAPAAEASHGEKFCFLPAMKNREIGILLEGQIEAVKTTADGTSVSITHMGPGGIFGDVLSGSHQKSPVTILARTECTALFLPYEKIPAPMQGTAQLPQPFYCKTWCLPSATSILR